jgi:hypothetical protein
MVHEEKKKRWTNLSINIILTQNSNSLLTKAPLSGRLEMKQFNLETKLETKAYNLSDNLHIGTKRGGSFQKANSKAQDWPV